MAEADDAPSSNPFDQIDPTGADLSAAPKGDGATVNPFDAEDMNLAPATTSAAGAFVHAAEREVVPAAGGLTAAALGAAAGTTVGGPLGGLVGGALGFIGGSWGASTAQEYALSKAPDSWIETIGQDDRQRKLEQEQHPYATFLGGMAPYALTMTPAGDGGKAMKELLEKYPNATTLQRLLADPRTARVFGGAAMGGMELGQEAVYDDNVNWNKVAIATGFGMIFNRPNAVGERISSIGARAAGAVGLAPHEAPLHPDEPTVTEADASNIMGPGVTEPVYMGMEERDPEAAKAALKNEIVESQVLGRSPLTPEEQMENRARQQEPDLFAKYDAINDRMQTLRDTIARFREPPQEDFDAITNRLTGLNKDLDIANGLGMGLRANQLRAQISELETQYAEMTERQTAFREGRLQDTPEIANVRRALIASDEELRDLAPQVRAARLQAAEFTGSPTVAPPEPEAAPTPETPPAEAPATTPDENAAPSLPVSAQRAIIEQDVKRQLTAAGRPDDEAEAASKIIGARYETRAARLKGAAGSPLELYQREGADIRGPSSQPTDVSAKAVAEIPVEGKAPLTSSSPRPQGFTTAKGSIYTLHEDGTTTRNKSDHTEVGHDAKDIGLKPRSAKTVYVDDNAARLSVAGASNLGPKGARVVIKDGKASLLTWNEKAGKWGVSPESRDVPVYDTPAVGRSPLELWKPVNDVPGYEAYSGMHAGNKIVEVQGPQEREFGQPKRGNIRFDPDSVRPLITLTKNADASTFIHESGHQFLEEMFRDAEHPAAPDDLKADAQAVRDYLKLGDDETPIKKHHERFARSFEQYMREGVAPSKELAGVFAKFRDWLTKIYQTLRGLGRPISDDIRGVFDRMLAEQPQRTVVAPERAVPESMGAGHLLDAEHTAPEHAEAKAEKLAADRVRYVETLPPEVRNELESKVQPVETHVANATPAPEPGGEVAGSEERPAAVANGNEGSDAVPGRAGGGEQPGGRSAGGSEAAGTGAGVSGGVKPTDRQPPRPLATLPTDDISGVDERTVDRAGNIRVENLTTDESIRDAIHASAERNADFRDVRGPVTRSQIADLAADMGRSPLDIRVANLATLFQNTQDLAAHVMAGRKALIESATRVTQMAVGAANGRPEDVAAFAKAIDLHDRLQRFMSGVTAEIGRGLGSGFVDISGADTATALGDLLQQQTGRTFDQLVQIAKFTKNLDSPAKVSTFLRNSQNRTFGRMILEYYINNLISGPVTHATYMIGNTALLLNRIGPETLTAAAIGRFREAGGAAGREHVLAGESLAGARELIRSLPKAAQAATEALRTGLTTRLPGETAYPIPVYTGDTPELRYARVLGNEDVTWREAKTDAFGLIRGMRDGIVANWGVLKAGGEPGAPLVGLSYSPLGQIPDLAIKGVPVVPLGSLERVPSRMIAAIHSFFRTLNYSVANAGEAYRIAATEGHAGAALDQRVAELRQNPSEQTMERSKAESNALTLMDQGGDLVKNLTKLTNWAPKLPGLGETPVLKFIDPFIHISGNIIDQAIVKRTPIGLLSESMRADLTGKNGSMRQDMAQARMLVGTAMAVSFGTLAAEGYINGSGPTDPKRAAVWRQAGNRAYSVRIGDIWYDMHRLGPLGMLLGLSADAYDVSQHFSSEGFQAGAAAVVHAFAQNIVDESFMRGPAELMQAIEQHDRYGQRYVQNFFSSFVPFSVGMSQMARASDPYSRQARTILDAMRAKMPFDAGFGQSTDLMPRRDIWGEPVLNPDAVGGKGVTAIWKSPVSADPVNLTMDALNMGVAQPRRSILNVKLTDQQYDDYQRIAGRMTKQRLDVLVNAPDFKTWPPAVQRDAITKMLTASREGARQLMMAKYPDIPRQAMMQKLEKHAAR